MGEEATPKITCCGHLALPKFRRQAEGMMSPCVCEPEHSGNHVYAVHVRQGTDYKSHAIHYLEEIKRTELKPVMNVDMDGNQRETQEELAAIYIFFTYRRESRSAGREGT